jgi:predicted enzyme related to lactoylglutathione lyase
MAFRINFVLTRRPHRVTLGVMTNEPASNDSGVESRMTQPGSITYMQIPAVDARASAAFYEAVFGWTSSGSDAHVSFGDAHEHLRGAFVTDLTPSTEPGVLPYIYVDGIDAVLANVKEHGGQIVRDVYPEGGLSVATFRDPAGNVMGVWQATPR